MGTGGNNPSHAPSAAFGGEDLSVVVERVDDEVAVVRVGGELDHRNVGKLAQAGLELVADGARRLVVDMAAVRFCDSSGLGSLVKIHRAVDEVGGSVALAAVPGRLGRLIQMTGIDQVIAVYPDAEAALAHGVPGETSAVQDGAR